MSDFKRKLDEMMGDTTMQERRIKQRVHEKLQTPVRKFSWQVVFVSAAIPVVALMLFFTMNPTNQLSSDLGPGVPYDPLDDLAQISALQKKQQLSAVDYEEFATLPHFDNVDGLHYVDKVPFSIEGSSETFHTVIERKENLFDEVVYETGDIVRTMTNTTSHLPTYTDVYYEVLAVPGDRVVLRDGELRINGKPVKSGLMDRYEEQGIRILGGYEQVLNAREYFLLNHFPASGTVQGATITPVHKIFGQVVGVATEERTESMYLDYLAGQVTGDYTPEQYFDLYLYDDLLGYGNLLETPAFTQVSRLGELFLEASYRRTVPVSDNEVEIRYEYGREGVAEQVFTMKRDADSGRWVIAE
ncbi:S26 family signal peptidase [Sporosarcina sp. ACRSL]|uniref:S26 family signal peptidase n=1 Tax=Sporosarcina sp. ACRSL TaxID=2918215 RepID=UPI001EF66CF5|nr:S26 family signal peptidase [Sporosarcina sp. ACRSL]MCG7344888.1 S26 family signal peptidase [Sporosarcina sp. ACRSL]